MPQETVRVCVDQVLTTDDELIEAMEAAVEENPANLLAAGLSFPPGEPPEPAQLALLTGYKWRPGRTLRFRFLDGDPQVHAKVEQFAKMWTVYANIGMEFGNDPNAEIRISFAGSGSWSTIGTSALTRAAHIPTMNFGWLTPSSTDNDYERVVVHEVGHALGCVHEHSSPAAGIPWDKPKVYAYYATHGWDKAKVDLNLFTKYSAIQTQFSEYDPLSIMHYHIPNEHTIGDFEVGWNGTLSDTDKDYIGKAYPFPAIDATELGVGAAATQASIGAHGEEDLFTFDITSAGSYTVETAGPTDVVMGLYGPDSLTLPVAQDDDSGQAFNAKIEAALAPGTYWVRVRHFLTKRTGQYSIRVWAG